MQPHTFPRESRLRRRSEFLRTSGEGRKFHGRCFLVIAAAGVTGRPRLGITVTRKVGNAVVRNRIKRQAREFFRRRRADLGCWDINVIAKRQAAGQNSEALRKDLEDLFDRLDKHTASAGTPANGPAR